MCVEKLSLILLLFVCEKMHNSRYQHHDKLRHYDKFQKEKAIEKNLWPDWQGKAVYMVQSHR